MTVSHGRNEPTIVYQLPQQHVRAPRRTGCDQHPLKWGLLRPPQRPVSHSEGDVRVTEPAQCFPRLLAQLRHSLHRKHIARQLGQDRGLVARAGPHLQDSLFPGQVKLLGHQRHHVGLRDSLPVPDAHGAVAKGALAVGGAHELLARHPLHRVQNSIIAYAPARKLPFHHPAACNFVIRPRIRHPADPRVPFSVSPTSRVLYDESSATTQKHAEDEMSAKLETRTIVFSTEAEIDIVDVTKDVADILNEVDVSDGTVAVFVPGSTGALSTMEYEPGLVKDIKELFEKIAPRDHYYHHEERWHDKNGHSHVRASLIGPSVVIPFRDNRLMLGTWQQIVFFDFDVRARERELIVQIMGE